MALSQHEEQVVAELEAQFQPDPPPAWQRNLGRLALPALCFLGGVAFLVAAARDAGLVIRMSDFSGYATSSLAASLSLAGYVVLLGSAFLFGRVWCECRQPRPGPAGVEQSTRPAGAPASEPDGIRPRP